MLIISNRFMKYTFLLLTGGFTYGCVEILFRGFSHISMFLAGGICFILIGLLNERITKDRSLFSRMLLACVIITLVELIFGIIVNLWLKLNVWDYSHLPGNILGQICLLYSVFWFLLSLPGILLNDYLRYYFLGEEKPRYRFF